MSLRYAVPALAAIGGALAQGSCSVSATQTIQNAGDASALGGCATFTGSIAIATGASNALDFGGLQNIQGSFDATGDPNTPNNVTSISANSLQSIRDDFNVAFFNGLTSLNMQQLSRVGRLNFNGLGQLNGLNFGRGINASSIIVSNTGIQDLSPLNVLQAQTISILNNQMLHNLTWSTTNVTNLTLSGNAVSGSTGSISLAASFASLLGAGSIDMSNVSSVDLSSLSNTTGGVSILGSPVSNLSFPNLTSANGVRIQNCPNLQGISFPMLRDTGMGALNIINNDKLSGNLQFPALRSIGAVLNITGAFSSVAAPQLNHIGGVVNIQSTSPLDNQTCATFGPQGTLHGSGQQLAGATCQGSVAGTPGSVQGSRGSSSSKAAAPLGFEATPATLFGSFGLVAAILGIM